MARDAVHFLFKSTVLYVILQLVSTVTTYQQPEQIHISLGSNNNSMVVMWSSRDQLQWEVHYGTVPFSMQMAADSSMTTLPETHVNAAKYVYRSELDNLVPATTYFYKIVSKDELIPMTRSRTYSFKTLPDTQTFAWSWDLLYVVSLPGGRFVLFVNCPLLRTLGVAKWIKDSGAVSRFVVYGDMGAKMSQPTRTAIEALRKKKEIYAILHVGDFAYNLGSDAGRVGDIFMNEIEHLAAEIPYMTAPGNHEIQEDFEPYRKRFSTPNSPWPIPLNKMWYSFDVGLVHFISYSTEVYFTYEEMYVCEQFDWLLQDLIAANQNREKTPWIIAFGHRPMYCSNGDGDDCTDALFKRWVKTGLESLFHAQGVDLIIQAHEHSYERLYPMFDGKVERYNYTNPRAPVHIISGAAGSAEGIDPWSDSSKSWSAFRSGKENFQSFGILEIHNNTHLYFSQHDANDNDTADKFWMIQEHHGPFVKDIDCRRSADLMEAWSVFRSKTGDFRSFGILEIINRTHLFFSQNTAERKLVDKFWLTQENHGPFVENIDCLRSIKHESCKCRVPVPVP